MIRNTERALAALGLGDSDAFSPTPATGTSATCGRSPARGKVLVTPDARYGEARGRAGPAVYPLVRRVLGHRTATISTGTSERSSPLDGRWRHPEAEPAELAADSPMPPARILACQPQHQDPHVGRDGRASSSAGPLPPPSAYERAMPPRQPAWGDQTRAMRGA